MNSGEENGEKKRAVIKLLRGDGSVEELPLEDYVFGAVGAEMPASFPEEALKAQAVAARTYALRKAGSGRHADADLCDDSGCCQAYRDPAALAERWGADAEFYTHKVRGAVEETAGAVLTYGGALIDAVYHGASDGRTADAASVWGKGAPYLVSVDTPEGEADVPNFRTEVSLSPARFAQVVLARFPAADLSGDPAGWLGEPERTDWGGVARVIIGGVPVTGREVRQLFGLRSARFDVEANETAVTFTVRAYGHGVGMSQYGAAALAREGAGYREILGHYYPGTEVEIAG